MRKLLMAAALAVGLGAGLAEARTVRWAASGDPNTMDPHSQNLGTVTMVLQQIYDPLIQRTQELGLAPGLATRWEQQEPTRWRFWLREGVRFHEGQAFTADDVVFSVGRAQQPTSNYGIFVDTIDRAVQVEPFIVDIVTRVPDPILPNKIASLMIMSRSWAEQHNATRPQNTRNREEMHTTRNTNGTGAFRLTVREPDVRTVMVRNTDWWGWQEPASREANIGEIIYRPIASDATRIAALLSNEVDFVLDPPLQDLNRLRAAQGIRVLEGPEVRTIFLAMDTHRDRLLYSDVTDRNPLKDLGVRQALICSGVCLFLGMITSWSAPIHTGESFGHEPSHHWEDPEVNVDIPLKHGPVMVVVEYKIAREDQSEFLQAMEKIRRIRLRNGVIRWGLYLDLAHPEQFREVYLEESWAAHLRQHERVSQYEAEVSQHAYKLHRGESMPEVFHYGYCDDSFPLRIEENRSEVGISTHASAPLWFLD